MTKPTNTMSLAQLEASFRLEDMQRIRQCLPAHMMALMVAAAQKTGLAVRADVLKHLNDAAAAPLARLDYQNVSRLAKRIDDAARTLLRDLSPDNPVEGLYCCAMFVMVLVDEGYRVDVARDGQAGLHHGLTRRYDVLVLDRGLPAVEGVDLLRRLRSGGVRTPALILTAR